MTADRLPRVDEHATDVVAPAEAVWDALREVLDRSSGRRGAAASYARLVGCVPSSSGGPRPLDVGSTVPGFRVVAATPARLLVLEGAHRFSTYALVLSVDERPDGRARLRAETRAAFPGLAGRAYRTAVIGSGGHRVAVRRLLADVRRRAETDGRAVSRRTAAPAG